MARKKPDSEKALSKERIVAAALTQIDRDGLAAFSLRDVARALGVYPTALYWHVPGRNALLAAVVEHALHDIWPPRGRGRWQAWLRALFHRYRAAVRRHPNVAPLIGAQLVSNAGIGPELVERILATLADAGFSGNKLVDAYNTVIAAKVGFVTMELAAAPDEDRARWNAAMRARISDVDAAKLPVLARNLKRLGNRAFILRWENGITQPLDSSFRLYVEVFIAGLERMRRS
jgi:AcrR family transcriptional regulator